MRRCASARRGRARRRPELPVNSQFHILSATTPWLQIGASIEDELESLNIVGDVAVSTHEDVNQMSYAVTFTSLGTREPRKFAVAYKRRPGPRRRGPCEVSASSQQAAATSRYPSTDMIGTHDKDCPRPRRRHRSGRVVKSGERSCQRRRRDRDDCWWSAPSFFIIMVRLRRFPVARGRAWTKRCTCLSPPLRRGAWPWSTLVRVECDHCTSGPGVIQVSCRGDRLSYDSKIVDSRRGGPLKIYGTFGGENFNRRCRFDVPRRRHPSTSCPSAS